MSNLIDRIDRLKVSEGSLAFYALGQVGVAVKGPTGVLYIDPYLTDSDGGDGHLDRLYPPPVQPQEVTNADVVLVTHEHVDHFDPKTLRGVALASPAAHFAAPYTCDPDLAGITGERWRHARAGEAFEALGARITPVPSAHTNLEGAENGHAYLGYVVEWNGVTVYHAGDTVVWDGLIETLAPWRIDVAFLPINGQDYFRTRDGIIGNMDAREAAHLAEALDVKLVVPTHYDLFAGNAEDPGRFVSYLYRLNPTRRQRLLLPGELHLHVRED